uniref:Uncharacterized protein n=1 Tax=Chrysemys picta bellii TaxID=8478 RepID=A0A8C3IKQ2_CHRPI
MQGIFHLSLNGTHVAWSDRMRSSVPTALWAGLAAADSCVRGWDRDWKRDVTVRVQAPQKENRGSETERQSNQISGFNREFL